MNLYSIINKVIKEKAEILNLDNIELESLPPEIFELKWIKRLTARNNNIRVIPKKIKELHLLREIDLSNNKITFLPKIISELKDLEEINLNDNNIREFPEEITLLSKLSILFISDNLIGKIPNSISLNKNLISLDISKNLLTNIPLGICDLLGLENLDINSNLIINIPKEIFQLNNLRYLDLSSNLLSKLPQTIRNIPLLKYFKVDGNHIHFPAVEILNIDSLGFADIIGIRNYFTELYKSNGTKINEIKLIFVGNGRVGKTSTLNRLKFGEFNKNEVSTHGINIEKLILNIGEDEIITCNVWDFGGQDIFHATHRFFLTSRALYLLFWTKNNDFSDENEFSIDYWLDAIKVLGKSSPVIMVQNKIDKVIFDLENSTFLRKEFNVKNFVNISAYKNKNLNILLEIIKNTLKSENKLSSIYGYILPNSWGKVLERLEELSNSKNYIFYEEYLEICEKENIDESTAQTLSHWLHESGKIIHFYNDEILWEVVFLSPRWVTDRIYRILDNSLIIKKGNFAKNNLNILWTEESNPSQVRKEISFVIGLLKKFEICFQLPESSIFIIPQLLPFCPKEIQFEEKESTLHIIRKFNFLFKGIFNRLIVRLSKFIKEGYYWKDLFILNYNESSSLVRYSLNDKTIEIIVNGKETTFLYKIICNELNSIVKGITYSDYIRTYCIKCHKTKKPCFNEVKLLKRVLKGESSIITCPKSSNLIDIDCIALSKNSFKGSISDEIHDLIKKGNSVTAIDKLGFFFKQNNRDAYNELVILKGTYANLTKKFYSGVISEEDRSTGINKINKAILNYLDNLNNYV